MSRLLSAVLLAAAIALPSIPTWAQVSLLNVSYDPNS